MKTIEEAIKNTEFEKLKEIILKYEDELPDEFENPEDENRKEWNLRTEYLDGSITADKMNSDQYLTGNSVDSDQYLAADSFDPWSDWWVRRLYKNILCKKDLDGCISDEDIDKLLLLWVFQDDTAESKREIEKIISLVYCKTSKEKLEADEFHAYQEKLEAIAFKAYREQEEIRELINNLGYGDKFAVCEKSYDLPGEDANGTIEQSGPQETLGPDPFGGEDWVVQKFGG